MDDYEYVDLAVVTIFLAAILTLQSIKIRRSPRWWVRPSLMERKQKGHYHNLFQTMRKNDPEYFFKYTRMTVDQFDTLLNLIKPKLLKRSRREALTPEHRLTITLYYLAHGGSMQAVSWAFLVSKTTVCRVVYETCQVIWNVLSPIYLKPPTTEDWKNIVHGFSERWNFPNCVGALDGKHIVIQAPKKSGSQYFNYKKSFSIVLMAACDHDYMFTLVDIGAFGSQSDGGVFRESAFGKAFEDGDIVLPVADNLHGSSIKLPMFMVADEAFPLKPYIMRPYPGINLSQKQLIFNYRLSRARRIIENAFGILASRWRIYRSTIIAEVHTVERIVCATVCLHNFLRTMEAGNPKDGRMYCPVDYVDSYDSQGNFKPGQYNTICNSQG